MPTGTQPPSLHRLISLLPLLAAAGCSAATAKSVSVSDDRQLESAIASARAGDRITLAPGNYGPLLIQGRKIEGAPVILVGNRSAIASMQIFNSSGWTISNVEFAGGLDSRGRIVRVENSSNIRLTDNLIRGQTLNNDPWDDKGLGVGLRNVDDVELRNNRFREVKLALQVGSSRNVSLVGNSFAYIREGVNWVGVDGGKIRCNRFSHFFPNYGLKEHPDAIQFWHNESGGSSNLLIEGNFLNLGGPRAVHGIFGGGTQKPEVNPIMRMRDITVRDNIYYGSALHGISLAGAQNILIERNTVLGSDHVETQPVPQRTADGRNSSALVPRIRLVGATSSGRIADNIAPSLTVPPTAEGDNNLTVQVRGNGNTPWRRVFTNPPEGENPPLESFIVDPRSEAGRKGQGARLVCGADMPPAP